MFGTIVVGVHYRDYCNIDKNVMEMKLDLFPNEIARRVKMRFHIDIGMNGNRKKEC